MKRFSVKAIHGAAFRDAGANGMAVVRKIMKTLGLDRLQVPPNLVLLLERLPEPSPDMEWEKDEDEEE